MRSPPSNVSKAYLILLDKAIVNLRMRIRYGENLSNDEIHDLLDAIHNIPEMLHNYGGWFVEGNINQALLRFDERWQKQGSSDFRISLIDALQDAKCKADETPNSSS